MNSILKQIELMDRIDQLVRMKVTGTPESLATKLEISKAKLYRIIHIMKILKAPLVYNTSIQSFVYEDEVNFQFGFYNKRVQEYA